MCHIGTCTLHQVAQLDITYHIVIRRSTTFVLSALKSQSQLVCDVFAALSHLVYTSSGYNSIYKFHHRKVYTEQDYLCAKFVYDVRLAPDQNNHLLGEVFHVCKNIILY